MSSLKCASFLLFIFLLCSCKTFTLSEKKVNYYQMDSTAATDKEVVALIAPYKHQMEAEMDQVIGQAAVDLENLQPEGPMGNFVADAIMNISSKKTDFQIDCAISNFSGLRIPVLAAGPITRGQIFELMPFDNLLVVMELDGNTTLEYFNHIAKEGGWSVSAEIKMGIENGIATYVAINNQPLAADKTYHILTSDYLANGGNDCDFLADQPRIDTGILLRDALIEFIQQENAKGQPISAKIEGRVK